jgi:predicted  nucleic acid-binding Zn-ribbon protein
MRRREGRRKQLLNNLKQKRRYWYLKKELQIALSGEISLEGAMELLQDRI